MKKKNKLVILAMLAAPTVASSLAQGTLIFENSISVGSVTIGPNTYDNYAAAGSYTVALLWAPGTMLGQPQSVFVQLTTFGPAGTGDGYFYDGSVAHPNPITTPSATAPGATAVFEVQGWTGNFTSYAAAVAGHAQYVGQTAQFLNATGGVGTAVPTTGWDGNLILVPTPEPGTLAVASVGAAVWLLCHRKK